MVGLIVGPKGVTIKRIQQLTNTFIITPSREMDPVFEITGTVGCIFRMSFCPNYACDSIAYSDEILSAFGLISTHFLGLVENVEAARFEIESHLNNRTRWRNLQEMEFARNGIEMVEVDPETSAS